MPWDASDGAGFTSPRVRPWLPVGDVAACNVAGQSRDPDSALSLCRRLIAMRHAEFGGRAADYKPLPSAEDSWSYRVGGITVLANFSDERLPATPPAGDVLLASYGKEPAADDDLVLEPWQGLVYRTS